MADFSLYSINAILILDNEGKRLFAKYYTPIHSTEPAPFPTLKSQLAFESSLFSKTYKLKSDIILFENQVVVYKEISDIIIYIIGNIDENEACLYQVLIGLRDALDVVLRHAIDKKSVQENYDFVCLAIDETCDDGIILETEGSVIASRVSTRPSAETPSLRNIELSEKGVSKLMSFLF
ncbi:coatomer subunit zeta [Ascoidea rubescens DSM 1968]|uniref:Coatomer subunit zeta n=1 Tax=Ascoidea rubescens DSM 1968 TaxID=1344418 RepID=A0A1D2VA92_9ASCO|nr:putative subunit of the coatomer complex [Ascoidea rubescens DSM 1968]ODV58574.1 putative subunit of the coatomer complex [Ascoidea rubescens DSM 1968]